ncbi:MAG: methylmalonyl-CoA mutase family protein, partial [candidate division WOR-3 bacterium]
MDEREIKRESCSSGQDFYSSIETKKAEVIEDLEERIKRLSQKNSRFPGSITPFEKLYYTSKDVENLNYEKDLGNPGEFPFTRGVYETMYRGKLWTMRMFSG